MKQFPISIALPTLQKQKATVFKRKFTRHWCLCEISCFLSKPMFGYMHWRSSERTAEFTHLKFIPTRINHILQVAKFGLTQLGDANPLRTPRNKRSRRAHCEAVGTLMAFEKGIPPTNERPQICLRPPSKTTKLDKTKTSKTTPPHCLLVGKGRCTG